MDKGKTPEEEFVKIIEKQVQKKQKARNKGREVLLGLGLFGIIGWSIAMPTLGGIALGVYLDRRFATRYSFTLMLLLGGVVLGCLNAWHWIKEKSKED